jgi:hypothetical protein
MVTVTVTVTVTVRYTRLGIARGECCSLTADGGDEPTSTDWEMVNRAQRCPEGPSREVLGGLGELLRDALSGALGVP